MPLSLLSKKQIFWGGSRCVVLNRGEAPCGMNRALSGHGVSNQLGHGVPKQG